MYEDDEPIHDVVKAFEDGIKTITVQKYTRRASPPAEAMQWKDGNKEAVLVWLTFLQVRYSYHEISSAGELYIYLNGGPVMVYPNDYIVKIGSLSDILIYGEENFVETWAPLSDGNR